MNKLFETQRQTLIDEYEKRLRELEELKNSEFETMRKQMQ
jgi:hypothetical protein|tara:strand:- start:603 stop:722 length:120 start_codon:yes stop_codon:yes gene_type:complete